MQAEEFRHLVKENAFGDEPAWALDAAAEHFIANGLADRDHVMECVALARRSAAKQKEQEQAEGRRGLPGVSLTSEALAEAIRPRVEQTRRTLFNIPRPPFRSVNAAARWVESESPRPRRLTPRDLKRAEALFLEGEAKLREYQGLVRREVRITERPRALPYLKPGRRPTRGQSLEEVQVTVGPETTLAELERASRQLAEATGFRQIEIVMHLLTGVPLSLPAPTLSTTYRRLGERPIRRRSTVIETFSPAPTLAEFSALQRALRDALQAKRLRPLTAADGEFLGFVQRRCGEAAAQTQRAFWEGARVEWNRTHPSHRYSTWRGLEMRYDRLKKKIEIPLAGAVLPGRPGR